MFLKKLGLVLFSVASLGLTACSGQNWVNGIDLGTQEQNGEEYVRLTAEINTRALQMASVTIPIYDPQNPTSLIGQLSLAGGMGTGSSDLSILIKSSVLLKLPTGSTYAVLPNGTPIPVAGVNANQWMAIPLGGGSSKIYFNLDLANSKAVFGATLNLEALNPGVTANVLFPFNVNQLSGLAGIYTGAAAGQSGFALFANASTLLSSSGSTILFMEKAKSADASRVQKKILELENKKTLLKAR